MMGLFANINLKIASQHKLQKLKKTTVKLMEMTKIWEEEESIWKANTFKEIFFYKLHW